MASDLRKRWTGVDRIGHKTPSFPPQVPQALLVKQGVLISG